MSAPLLNLKDIGKSFVVKRSLFGKPLQTLRALDGIDLTLKRGETLAIVGESGCGKSTLARVVLRLIDPSEGDIVFDGETITAYAPAALRAFRRKAQLIFQDPFASLNPRMTVGDILAEPLMLHQVVPAKDRSARVGELLKQVGLKPQDAKRFPHEFSGGQRQRIAIARALAVEPDLIICDEPVSALDVSIRAQILNLLADLKAKLGLSLLFISHDLSVVRSVADRVAVMYLGRVVEEGRAEDIFANPRHPYTRALVNAVPLPIPRRGGSRALLQGDVPSPIAPPPGCHFQTRCPLVMEACRTGRPPLSPCGSEGHRSACIRHSELPAYDSPMRDHETAPALKKLMAAFVQPAGMQQKAK
ncbi:MAG: dipeptide ABC transporter ATP-binding protein [Beijerinckiaceae bacterium]|nr:dipeptide ABC transporter ATP-binding protein [Beijerinckiaceae bacterium]